MPIVSADWSHVTQEFVVCRFATPRIPKRLEIYETSAPGALVRISGRAASGWIELWSGHADKTQMYVFLK